MPLSSPVSSPEDDAAAILTTFRTPTPSSSSSSHRPTSASSSTNSLFSSQSCFWDPVTAAPPPHHAAHLPLPSPPHLTAAASLRAYISLQHARLPAGDGRDSVLAAGALAHMLLSRRAHALPCEAVDDDATESEADVPLEVVARKRKDGPADEPCGPKCLRLIGPAKKNASRVVKALPRPKGKGKGKAREHGAGLTWMTPRTVGLGVVTEGAAVREGEAGPAYSEKVSKRGKAPQGFAVLEYAALATIVEETEEEGEGARGEVVTRGGGG
ncbi:hypothetical protein MMC13_007011 [Lambiella insularis]|nr:hypothetical protein [Lambiella insularis]